MNDVTWQSLAWDVVAGLASGVMLGAVVVRLIICSAARAVERERNKSGDDDGPERLGAPR